MVKSRQLGEFSLTTLLAEIRCRGVTKVGGCVCVKEQWEGNTGLLSDGIMSL